MIKDIQKIICHYFKIDLPSLRSRTCRQEICYPRSIAIYLCRKYTNETLKVIGKAFNRKHPVILYNYEKVKIGLEWNTTLRNEVDLLAQRIPWESNKQDKEIVEKLENEYLEIIGIY